eukprot:CAMPEP_0177674920 /NCGR_PEP_ID=MMETSP0447-20121125/26875_1 /TAXON_ID=0 /ORGANISM="Stygamoeba regulata, Strain BSH-02190019" /LENGTH=31 /DNA_ID= /DNA_START= /DNA_END= /DNA_ORIENTATION=
MSIRDIQAMPLPQQQLIALRSMLAELKLYFA